jgi:hypothetical protein
MWTRLQDTASSDYKNHYMKRRQYRENWFLIAIADPLMSTSATVMQIVGFLLPMVGKKQTSKSQLCWCQRPSSDLCGRKTHSRVTKPGNNYVDSCSTTMTGSRHNKLLALCHLHGKQCSKRNTQHASSSEGNT